MGKTKQQCPECGEELDLRTLAPCDNCGWDEQEIAHFNEGKHSYAEYEVYGSKLILCNFCSVDFSSYNPQYWGLPNGSRVGFGSSGFFVLHELVNSRLHLKKGMFCPNCKATAKLIVASLKARETGAT